jgi:hypothetical protein
VKLHFSITVEEHGLAYCKQKESVKIPAVNVKPDRDLKQFAELHSSLTSKDEVVS